MARRIRRGRRSRGFKRYSRGRSSGLAVTGIIVGGGIYGALRNYISSAISPLTSKIPLGNVADNIGMGIVSYLAYKKGSGIIKNAGMIGLGIESAAAASSLMASGLGGGASSGNAF